MMTPELERLAKDTAAVYSLDPNLVKAIITVESQWDTWAMRYEIGYRYLYFHRTFAENAHITPATEEMLQKTSWGLMQVMGGLARELGLKTPIPSLCFPEVGLKYGCSQLKRLSQKYAEESQIIAAYNAGSPRKTLGGMYENQQYVDKVYRVLLSLRQTPV